MLLSILLGYQKNELEEAVVQHYDGGDEGHTRGDMDYLSDLLTEHSGIFDSEIVEEQHNALVASGYTLFAVHSS